MTTQINENLQQNNSSGNSPESNKQPLNEIRKNITIFLTSNFKKVIKGEYNHHLSIIFDMNL
jgi:hypothetical protein